MRRTVIFGFLGVVLVVIGCRTDNTVQLETNKELVRRFTDAGNASDWAALTEVLTEDFSRHSAATAGPSVTSRDGFIELQRSFLQSFPDQQVTLHEMVAEGDYVAVRATYSGTQTGPMAEFPATGRAVSSPFLALFRIEGERIAELWVEWDNVALLTQLGLFPPPAGP